MPSRWSYESLVEFAQTNPAFMEAGAMALPPLFFGLLFVLIAAPVLSLKKY